MDSGVYISDMRSGQELEGFYILKEALSKTSSNGRPYLTGSLADSSGTIELKVWDYGGPIGAIDTGKIVKVRGAVSEFKGNLQFTANRIRLALTGDSYDLTKLVPSAPIDLNETYARVCALVDSIEDEDYRKVCKAMLERHGDEFRQVPAAKSVHHAFVGGLLMHTANMLKTADYLAALYSDVIDRSLLLTGTLLHDFAKMREFNFSKLGLATDYSVSGQLIGHLVMGAQDAASLCAELGVPELKSVLLQHMLLSHHGQPEYGAAVVPMCAEVELLSYIDLIDSRMEIYAETLESVPVNSFSGRVFSLDNKRLFNHG